MTDAVAIAVLAAGRGTRFGGDTPKQLATLNGRPLFTYALDAARASGIEPVLCVVSDDRVAALVPPSVEVLRNDAPDEGIASSLRVVLRALVPRDEIDAVVIGLADQPRIGPEAYRRVAAADAPLAAATYSGERSNPVRIARPLWDRALALTGDNGARLLMQGSPPALVPCDDTGDPSDVDTPDDLTQLEQVWRSQTASG